MQMTTSLLRAMTISALVATIALSGPFTTASVRAGEYCSEDDSSFTRNCRFSSMEQCKAAISGMNGACLRDPFLKDDSIEANDRSPHAYAALPSHRAHIARDAAAKNNK